jgi:hypothetical protein
MKARAAGHPARSASWIGDADLPPLIPIAVATPNPSCSIAMFGVPYSAFLPRLKENLLRSRRRI